MYSEQGGQSIHAEFNGLSQIYNSVKPSTKRLKCMMEQHHMKVQPVAKSITPSIKRRKKERNEE